MEFLADTVCVDLEVVMFVDVPRSPDTLEDHSACADLPDVAGEVGQKVELFGREVNPFTSVARFIVQQVER